MARAIALAFFTCTPLAGLAACSSGDSGSSADAGADTASCVPFVPDANVATPATLFQRDVLPIFQMSCSIAGSTCHGDPSVTGQARPFLGFLDGGADAAGIHNGIVGVASAEDPQMSIVTAGDPVRSYMLHKIDGDQCTLAAACAQSSTPYTDCGLQMPYSYAPLDGKSRDAIRRWVAQGAKND